MEVNSLIQVRIYILMFLVEYYFRSICSVNVYNFGTNFCD